MSGLLAAIAAFIGRILREILPAIFDERRRQRKTKVIGKEPIDAVNADIKKHLPKD